MPPKELALADEADGLGRRETMLRERAGDESLSEETREGAKRALDELVSTQLGNDRRQALLLELEAERSFDKQFVQSVQSTKGLAGWLGHHRLLHHKGQVLCVAGSEARPGDLQHLTEDNIEEIASTMTQIEMKRFKAAVAAVSEWDAARAEEAQVGTA